MMDRWEKAAFCPSRDLPGVSTRVCVCVTGTPENAISTAELQASSQENFKLKDTSWSCFLLCSQGPQEWLAGSQGPTLGGQGCWCAQPGLLFEVSLPGVPFSAQRPPEAPTALWFCHLQCPAPSRGLH